MTNRSIVIKTTIKTISCGGLVLAIMLTVDIQSHILRGAPATQPAGNDLEKFIFVLGAKANEAVSLAAATDAKRIRVRLFGTKRRTSSGKPVKYSELIYHIADGTISRITASIDVTAQSRKDIRATFEAMKRAGRTVTPSKDMDKDSKKVCVLIERPGKPAIMSIMDPPAVKSTWTVQFIMARRSKQLTPKRKAKHKAPSSGPAGKTPSTCPTKDPKRGWSIIAGIPVGLGVHKDRLASGFDAFKLQPEDVCMHNVHLRLSDNCIVELERLFYAVRPDGVVCTVNANVSENEKDVKKLRRLYQALKNSGKVSSKPRKPPDLLIEVIVPMRRTSKPGRVIVDWGESRIPARDWVFPFSISASLNYSDKSFPR